MYFVYETIYILFVELLEILFYYYLVILTIEVVGKCKENSEQLETPNKLKTF